MSSRLTLKALSTILSANGSGRTSEFIPRITSIAEVIEENTAHAWAVFSSITSAMLVIRGMNSDVLPLPLAERMVDSALRVRRLDIPDAGHAPFLNTREQISEISAFLADRSC